MLAAGNSAGLIQSFSAQQRSGPGVTPVEIKTVGVSSTHYATFQSHNQKVLANNAGIFVTYMDSYDARTGVSTWRLVQSTDGGDTFQLLYRGSGGAGPPAIEQDSNSNIYLVHAERDLGDALFYRFEPGWNYRGPGVLNRIHSNTSRPAGCAKFSLLYDPSGRNQLYYMTQFGDFYKLSLAGGTMGQIMLLQGGPHGTPQYPHLTIRSDGAYLTAAWTNASTTCSTCYYDIHFLVSNDGGANWYTTFGSWRPVSLPIISDDTGPAPLILYTDELNLSGHNWLANMTWHYFGVHFFYHSDYNRQHYVRFTPDTYAP